LLSYLCEPRPWCKKVVAIAHNAKAFDAQFILNRVIFLKWTTELILNGLKIVSMKIHHIQFLDSVSYMPMPLRKLPEAFGLQASKSWFPHLFNTKANLDYVGPIPDIKYYGADEMSDGERREFMAWYNEQKLKVFDSRRVLEQYCQDDVTVLRQACRVFRREFLEIGNIEVFLEALTIASACNKVLRKKFLKSETIGLIPPGGYSANRRYSKKALMGLLHMEQADGCHIQHSRNGHEYRPPELPHYSVDGYSAEARTIYEFLGCYYHGCKCQSFRDVKTLASGKTLAERYEQTLARIELLKRAGYTVKVQWECEFEGVADDLRAHPIVSHVLLNTRDALYGVEPRPCVFNTRSERVRRLTVLRYESLPVHQQIYQVPHRSYDHSRRGHMRRHRSLSKEGRTDGMQDRATQGPLSPRPTIQMGQEAVILPVPHVSTNTTLRANADISVMPRDAWKALGSYMS